MAISEKLKALVDQLPAADGRGLLTEDINKAKIEKTISLIHEGGRENVEGLIDLLGEPGSEENVKPHYALHCLANHVLLIKDEPARRAFCELLAAALDGELSADNKAFVCQELQWAGGKEAIPALGKLLLDEALVEPAAMALAAIGDGAAEQFRAALPKAKGKCRLNVIQGLGAVEDAPSAGALRESLGDPDRESRLAAGWALARIADAGSVDALLEAADVEPGWERIQATKHCLVLAERLSKAGNRDAAAKIYKHLRDTRSEPAEKYIGDVAEKALSA